MALALGIALAKQLLPWLPVPWEGGAHMATAPWGHQVLDQGARESSNLSSLYNYSPLNKNLHC